MYSNLPLWVTTLILIHVLANITAIGIGVVTMRAKKGGKRHTQTGKIFFWSMMIICLTGSLLLFYNFNVFLAFVTVLSFYTVLTGYRAPTRRKSTFAGWIDWAAAIFALLSGLSLFGSGIAIFLGMISTGVPTVLGTLCLIFGILMTLMSFDDIKQFRNPPEDKLWWYFHHADRMLSSYMALMVALSTQTFGRLVQPQQYLFVWLIPAVIGIIWINIYLKKLREEKQVRFV